MLLKHYTDLCFNTASTKESLLFIYFTIYDCINAANLECSTFALYLLLT